MAHQDMCGGCHSRRAVIGDIVPRATGAPIIIEAAGAAVIAAFTEALAWALGAILLLLLLRLRSLADALMVLLPLGLAALMTVALAGIIDLPFNFANVIVLPLIFGLGVDSGIHMVARARGLAGHAEEGETLRAILLSALTTLASFGALSFSAHPGTASMGQLLTLAVLLGVMATLTVLPALLALRSNRQGT